MKKDATSTAAPGSGSMTEAFADVQQSFEGLYLAAGMEASAAMMEVEAAGGRKAAA